MSIKVDSRACITNSMHSKMPHSMLVSCLVCNNQGQKLACQSAQLPKLSASSPHCLSPAGAALYAGTTHLETASGLACCWRWCGHCSLLPLRQQLIFQRRCQTWQVSIAGGVQQRHWVGCYLGHRQAACRQQRNSSWGRCKKCTWECALQEKPGLMPACLQSEWLHKH